MRTIPRSARAGEIPLVNHGLRRAAAAGKDSLRGRDVRASGTIKQSGVGARGAGSGKAGRGWERGAPGAGKAECWPTRRPVRRR
jgi:hypothetical protein